MTFRYCPTSRDTTDAHKANQVLSSPTLWLLTQMLTLLRICLQAGDKFTERHDQEALLQVLNTCDHQYAWPTGHAQENLKSAWGWAEST